MASLQNGALAWETYTFAGIIPRMSKKQLPEGYATVAHDVDLTHGTLKSFHEPKKVADVSENSTYMHAWSCNVYAWDKCVDVAEWLPDAPRLFITGNADYPQVAILNEQGELRYRRLGVPAPQAAPEVHGTSSADTDLSREVCYVATFVNFFGEEGAPSEPSNTINIEDGQPVEVVFNYNPPIEYDIRFVRIYRREAGFIIGSEEDHKPTVHWFLVDEVPVTERGLEDSLPIELLGPALETLTTREPPAELENITALTQTGILAGNVKNKLLFSRNLQPNNWELSQEMTLDDNIAALGSRGSMLFVATDGYPYRIQADVGCDKRECRQVVKYPQPYPMINCHTGHGSVVTPFGFIYACPEGLVMLNEEDANLITTNMLSADDWRKLEPHTARLAYHNGALFVVTNKISFILWLDTNTYHDSSYKKMVTISDQPLDMVNTRQGELLMLKDGEVFQWDAGNALRPYRWVSRVIELGHYIDLTRVRAEVKNYDAYIEVFSEHTSIGRKFVTGDHTIPFGRHGRCKEFYMEITGIGEVTEVVAGISDIDIRRKG